MLKKIDHLRKTLEASTPQSSVEDPVLRQAVEEVVELLDQGHLRVATFNNNCWVTHGWIKLAILLYFRIQKVAVLEAGALSFVDKIPPKKWTGREEVRVVPPATARRGSFVGKGVVLMPSLVNIGAYVDSNSMVDSWATVGSCAQIGKNVHISGGVGIGGVLEPMQNQPVIVEDGVFIGSRSIIVEGVLIEQEAVLGANVTLTASTQIIDVTEEKPKIYRGRVPARSVVIPGTVPKSFAAGTYGVPCALIIGSRKASTDKKTSLNEVLREFELQV